MFPYLWKDRQKNHRTMLAPGLRFFTIAILVLGVYFRFINLDRKVYWHDEAATLKKIYAYPSNAEIFKGQVIPLEDFKKSLRLSPEIGVIDTIKMVSVNDPKQGPLYFAMARLWAQWFGSSIAAIRSLSAFISLLVFPCLYWLCLELFQSSLVGWVAVALIAVSPFHVLYAQEARMYSLHTVNILLSSAAFLRAMRLKTKLSWGVYSATITLGLYTHLLFSLVAIGHGITVVVTERSRWSKTFIAYLIAALAGLLTFAPWLFFMVTKPRKVYGPMAWAEQTIPLSRLAIKWVINTSRLFFDIWHFRSITVEFAFLILAAYSIYYICRKTPKTTRLFVLTLTGITALTLAIPDFIFGGIRSNVDRYLTASYLGIHLSVAYIIGTKSSDISSKKWRHKLWQFAAIAVISCGVISCAISSQAELWWNKYSACEIPAIAQIVNQATAPLVIIDSPWSYSWNNAGSLSNFLNPKVRLLLLNESTLAKKTEGYSDVFLFNPSQELRNSIARYHTFKIVPAYQKEIYLGRLEKY